MKSQNHFIRLCRNFRIRSTAPLFSILVVTPFQKGCLSQLPILGPFGKRQLLSPSALTQLTIWRSADLSEADPLWQNACPLDFGLHLPAEKMHQNFYSLLSRENLCNYGFQSGKDASHDFDVVALREVVS